MAATSRLGVTPTAFQLPVEGPRFLPWARPQRTPPAELFGVWRPHPPASDAGGSPSPGPSEPLTLRRTRSTLRPTGRPDRGSPRTGPAACGDPARPGPPLPSATAPQCPLSRVPTSGSWGRGASPHGPPPVPPAGAAAGPRPGRPVQSAAEWGPALMARGPPSAPGTWPCSRRPPLCFSMVHVAHGLPGLEAEFVLRSGHCVVDLVSVQIGDLRCKCPAATRGTWSSPPQTICPPPRVPAHPSLSPAVSPWSAK